MDIDDLKISDVKQLYLDDKETKKKKFYIKPNLELLGDLRSVTLGSSTGTPGESPVNGLEYYN